MDYPDTSNGRPIFREVQRLQHAFLWIVTVVCAVIVWRIAWQRHLFHWPQDLPFRTKLLFLIAWLFFGVLLPLFLFWCRIVTEVRADGIYVRCIPFQFTGQRIPFTDFKRYEVRTCHILYDFGGHDTQEGFSGRAYNFGGPNGIQFNMVDGRQILIGSHRSDEFLQVLHSICGKSKRRQS